MTFSIFADDPHCAPTAKKSDPNLFKTFSDWKASPLYRAASKPRSRRFWSAEEELLVANYYPSDTPVREFAPVVGRTIAAIRAKARKLGFSRPKKDSDEKLLSPCIQRCEEKLEWSPDLDFLTVPLSQWKAIIPRDRAGRPLWYNNLIDGLRGVWCRAIAAETIAEIFGVSRSSVWATADSRNLPKRKDQSKRGMGVSGDALDALIHHDEVQDLARNALPRNDTSLTPGRDRYFQDAARSMRGAREAIRRRKRVQRASGGGMVDIYSLAMPSNASFGGIWA